MLDLGGEYFRFGVPSFNSNSGGLILRRGAVIQSHTSSILFDFVWIAPNRHVLIRALVACSALLVFQHLAEIGSRFPPGSLDAMPNKSEDGEHSPADQNAHNPTPRIHSDKKRKGHVEAQQPSPGELQVAQLRQMLPQKRCKREIEQHGK